MGPQDPAAKPDIDRAIAGPSFVVKGGHVVKWASWPGVPFEGERKGQADGISGWTQRLKRRVIIYKGFTSELFMPCMDPTDA